MTDQQEVAPAVQSSDVNGQNSDQHQKENSGSGSQFQTKQKFFGNSSEQAKMLMTGMSSMGANANTQMMQAKNNLKLMNHQQNQLQARLIKLNKEEEKAQKRIREAERQANFIAEMHQVKNQKMAMKQQMYKDFMEKEEKNRSQINAYRSQSKNNIGQNKLNVFAANKSQREEIREQQQKIRETIQANKVQFISQKQRQAAESYEQKRKAKYAREMNKVNYNSAVNDMYNSRISETNYEAEYVNQMTKKLEEQEALMLAKLQNTYSKEKNIMNKLNELNAMSPIAAKNSMKSNLSQHRPSQSHDLTNGN